MSELSQQILRHTAQTAEDTKAIRSLLEQHLGQQGEPKTEVHDNLNQFVLEMPEQAGTVVLDESLVVPEAAAVQAEQREDEPEQVSEQAQPMSRTEEILARFKKRVGGQA